MGSSIARRGRNVLPHRCGVRDLYDLRNCLLVLHRQERDGPATRERLARPDFLHSVPALLQLHDGKERMFALWWLLTLILGALFLGGTALEWRRLIYDEGLTISTNLFGTTYYSLVGLHAFHVTVGLIALTSVAAFTALRLVKTEHAGRLHVLSMYWHFVDGAWVVIFTVVYLIGR